MIQRRLTLYCDYTVMKTKMSKKTPSTQAVAFQPVTWQCYWGPFHAITWQWYWGPFHAITWQWYWGPFHAITWQWYWHATM